MFYDQNMQSLLIEGGFDAFAEASSGIDLASPVGASPGLFPQRLFTTLEGIDQSAGLEWRLGFPLLPRGT